jgi:hypothetical protein
VRNEKLLSVGGVEQAGNFERRPANTTNQNGEQHSTAVSPFRVLTL